MGYYNRAITRPSILKETLGHETLTHVDLGDKEIIARGAEHTSDGVDGGTSLVAGRDSLHFFSRKTGARIV